MEPTVKGYNTLHVLAEKYPEGPELFFIVTHGYVMMSLNTKILKGGKKNGPGKVSDAATDATADACNLIAAPIGSRDSAQSPQTHSIL